MHSEVNGDEDIKLKIYKQRNNNLDLKSISEMWTVTQDDIEYKITYVKQITNGNGFHLDVRGIPLFYDKFRTSIIHYLYNGSLTAVDYFTRVFDSTGYNFVLVNPSYAEQWEGFGKGQTRMELFKKGLDRYGYEFYIQGKTIYLKHQIGNDTNFEYRYKLNASNVSKAVDASALITHIKGFGNIEEGEEDYLTKAKLVRHATSPLADIVGIREPKVVVDGRITRSDTMDARLQKEIDESLYITVEATLHDVRQMGYETAVPLKGDRSFLVDERLGFDAEIRVQSVTTTKDERDRITQCDVVFGSANAGKRYKANLSTVAKNMADLLAGKIQLPFEVLESMSKDLLLKIQSVDSELLLDNGIFAIDKENPNNILGLNSAGIYISTDGGATAQTVITADGIVAESISAGSLIGLNITSIGQEGYFHVNGSDAEFRDTKKGRTVSISPDGIYGWNALGDTRFQADSLLVTSAALGTSNYNVYLAPMDGGEARVVRHSDIPGDGLVGSYNYQPIRADGFYGNYLNTNPAAPLNHMYLRPLSDWEVRVTRNGTTDHYQDFRAANIFANSLSNNTVFGESSHLFLKPKSDGEIRVTAVGSTESYKPVRAQGFYGDFIDKSAFTSSNHIYVRPGGDPGELRVTVRDTTNVYQPVRAKEFITDTSDRKNKKNIEVYRESTLDIFRNMDVYLYNRSTDKEDARKQLGAMIDELPEVTHSAAGDSFALYAYTSYLAKGIKDLIEVVDNQEKRIKLLEDK